MAKTVAELRKMAAGRGIVAGENWKKMDFLKVLSSKEKVSLRTQAPAGKKRTASKTRYRKSPSEKSNKLRTASTQLKKPPLLVLAQLPAEYGQDKVVSMQVSPGRVYVYWEVPEDKLAKYKGSLNLKVSDVKTNSFFYAPVSGRLGESFVNVDPASDCIIKLGVINFGGEFMDIMQQQSETSEIHTASSASHSPGDELKKYTSSVEQTGNTRKVSKKALPEEFFEMPEPVSSY